MNKLWNNRYVASYDSSWSCWEVWCNADTGGRITFARRPGARCQLIGECWLEAMQ